MPYYHVASNRSIESASAFINDLASRLNNRVQISTDAMNAYPEAIEFAFGREVDYAQIVKSYASKDGKYNPERKYSQPRIASSEKIWIMGTPNPKDSIFTVARQPTLRLCP